MKSQSKMDDAELINLVKGLVEDCEAINREQSGKRRKAIDYYNGVMADVPADSGRSSIVTREIRSTIKKILPAIRRVIFGSDKLVEYQPEKEGDEGTATQSSLYVNKVVVPESNVEQAVYDAFHSALLLDEGVLTWWHEEKEKVTVTYHSGIEAEELASIEADIDAEILSQSDYEDQMPDGSMVQFFKARVKRRIVDNMVKVAAVALEDFGIHPDATCVEDALIVYNRQRLRRSDLVALGYDKDVVEAIPANDNSNVNDDFTLLARDLDTALTTQRFQGTDKSLEMVEVYRCFVRCDYDGDGIAELREIHYVEAGEGGILFNDYADEANFSILVVERVPHSPRGMSIFDDVQDLQRLNTVLTRQGLDNLYMHNNPQPTYEDGSIKNPSSVTSPHFGEPIKRKQGSPPVEWNVVPFVADKAAMMGDRVKAEIVDRTGINSQSSSLDPNALQDVREQAVNMISDAASAQAWCMVRELAQGGLKRMFKGVLKLIVQHQDKPRTVRMNDEWVQFDPKSWNAEMDCVVNVGLGTGTRERDMQAVQFVGGMQEKVVAGFGPNNPFVGADEMYHALEEGVKAAGLTTVGKFFKKPQEGQLLVPPSGPSPEEIKMQAQMQLKQAEMQFKAHIEEVQATSDMKTAEYQAQIDGQLEQFKAQLAQVEGDQNRMLEKYKIDSELQFKYAQLNQTAKQSAVEGSQGASEIDGETGQIKQSPLMTAIMQQGEMLKGLHMALTAPKKVQFVQDETGRNVGGVVLHDFGAVN